MSNETERLEYKEIAKDELYKEVIAFANTGGGTLIIGISKTGETTPLTEIDDAYTRITNGIRDAIAPDVTIFTKYILEKDNTIRIEIGEGAYKPYYLKSKGLKPTGVYVRQGATSVPASPEQIRQMIKNADGDIFEELRSMDQSLTFEYCQKTFTAHNVAFGIEKYIVLGICKHAQGLYSNLGLILSDQCKHSVKIAVFADENNTIFRDRKEFTGSIFSQMDDAFDYLQLCNSNRSVINGLTRTDYWDYPVVAIREALINALIHRDYSFSGSIIINVNNSRIEFISLGGLLPGLMTEDILSGISQLRNRYLADVFHRLNFIESYGTGIRRILSLYENCPEKPKIDVTSNSFKLTLPNFNAVRSRSKSTINPQMNHILECIHSNNNISDEELKQTLKIGKTRLHVIVNQMVNDRLIKIEGRGQNKRYIAIVS